MPRLTAAQREVLRVLNHAPMNRATWETLRQHLKTSTSGLTRILGNLEELQLVIQTGDFRRPVIQLTSKGREAVHHG